MDKIQRLRKNLDFRRVYKKGKSLASPNLVLYYYPNRDNLAFNRVGFSISKKIGKAVVRNKLKRRLREIMRVKNDLKTGYDLVIIARKPAVNLEFAELKRDLDKLLLKAGILEKEG
ncbi:MAG: ribonuclease P protein component [Halanaerobiales bacterium]|mgnify:FL=1|nr:ribonuclease P protein component [Bacillota bacterium]HOA40776.1 ribonuclease P protein component [Halanaerobiales bacterium]HPZ62982.1 ribonuclease P protein component [Halanaerobiales bacterium]HQD04209.1 ribonuclease P protein component [Halanaerobiales bacterium]